MLLGVLVVELGEDVDQGPVRLDDDLVADRLILLAGIPDRPRPLPR
jgi:hypothetical protein